MSRMEELKVDKSEDLEKVTGGARERIVYGITCSNCGSNDLEVLQKDIFWKNETAVPELPEYLVEGMSCQIPCRCIRSI